MEIRVLRYFLEAAREENITKAAAFLHVSQPTLSRQLKELEEELGRPLFVRSSHRIHLTDAVAAPPETRGGHPRHGGQDGL